MSQLRQMHFAVFVQGTGNHIAGWRMPGAHDSNEDIGVLQEIAATAERGKFDMLFFADGLATKVKGDHPSFVTRIEPMTCLAALAMNTKHIGLGGTVSSTYSEPYTVARQFTSLDQVSKGRAAWNVVTTSNAGAAANYSRDHHPAHDDRYDIANEFVDVVKGLWDCWDDDAVVRDRSTGTFVDHTKVHPLNHKGAHFKVAGPLNMSRSPSGRPVIIQAGASKAGQDFAARHAEVVFGVFHDREEAAGNYRSFKSLLPKYGRSADDCKVLIGVMPIIGETDAAARATLNELQSFLDSDNALALVSARVGHDLSAYPLDGPVPDLPPTDMSHGFYKTLLAAARRENMTLRDLYNLVAAARGHWVLPGSVKTIADTLEQWFTTGAADGFIVMPAWFPQQFDAFVDQVVPELQRRGLFRTEYAGTTLRENLGLARPASPPRVAPAAAAE